MVKPLLLCAAIIVVGHTSRCIGQVGPAQDPPEEAVPCSPQEVADRYLEVRAHLDKSGEAPRYLLGEPVLIHLDLRDLSEDYLFAFDTSVQSGYVPSSYAVEATCDGKPVPLTILGQRAIEFCKQRKGSSLARVPTAFDLARTLVPRPSEEEHPVRLTIMANILCDMTDLGEYELKVFLRMRVIPFEGEWIFGFGPPPGPGRPVVLEVRPAKPLKLRVNHRRYLLESLPPVVPSG